MKNVMYSVVICSFVLCFSVAFAGPFGINMGTPISQLNVEKKISENKGIYKLKNVPEPHPLFDEYVVFATPQTGVFTVVATIKVIKTNIYGSELKSKFDTVHEKLSTKYGHSKDFDFLMSGSIWDKPEDFMMGLVKKERTLSSFWGTKEGSILPQDIKGIILEAIALNRNIGGIMLKYDFLNDTAAREKINKTNDKSL